MIAGVAAFAGGGLGSVLTPWATWATEKQRAKRDARAQLVREWRAGLAELLGEDLEQGVVLGPQTQLAAPLLSRTWYLSLRPHLPLQLRLALEGAATKLAMLSVADDYSSARAISRLEQLLPEIDRVERDWKLV